MIQVTVTIDFGGSGKAGCEKFVAIPERSTVLEALAAATAVIAVPRYGMEQFIESIDGVANDFAADCGWRFEVNGRSSNIPAERYMVKSGDWIKWFYAAGGCS